MIMLLINWTVILRKSSCGGGHLGLGPRFFLHLAEKWAALSSKLLSFLPFVQPQELPCYHGIGFRNVDYTGGVTCPSLVIHGTLDEVVPFRQGREIFRQLPEPKQFFKVERGQHNDLWEVGGSEYRDTLKEFIRSIGS
jgi:fermentation-respiration switch protein FrsA (DUF1100 family)